MKVKGVFFDLYGTLLIYGDMRAEREEWLAEFHHCLGNHGLLIPSESFVEYYKNRASGAEGAAEENGFTKFEQHIQNVCSDLRVSVMSADIKGIARELLTVSDKYVSIDPDCTCVLDELNRHCTVGLISNFDHPPHIHALTLKTGLNKFLAVKVVSGEMGVKKPDPLIFGQALRQTGLRPEETIYVGDSEEDMVGANGVGMISVLIDRNKHDNNYGQKYTIKSLKEILAYI